MNTCTSRKKGFLQESEHHASGISRPRATFFSLSLSLSVCPCTLKGWKTLNINSDEIRSWHRARGIDTERYTRGMRRFYGDAAQYLPHLHVFAPSPPSSNPPSLPVPRLGSLSPYQLFIRSDFSLRRSKSRKPSNSIRVELLEISSRRISLATAPPRPRGSSFRIYVSIFPF